MDEQSSNMIVFKCFNVNQPAQIPLSSIDLDAWHLRDTSIANLIKHGVREFFIHTDNVIPLMSFIHKAVNPGRDILKEIAASQEILDMEKYNVLDVCGTSQVDKFKPHYIACTDENSEIMRKMIYDQYFDQLETENDGTIDQSYNNFIFTFSYNMNCLDLNIDITEHILYQMEKDIMKKT